MGYDPTRPNPNGTIHLSDGTVLPEQGLGTILAVAVFINDADVIGNGNNIGYLILTRENGDRYAQSTKIDPGEAFNTMPEIIALPRYIRTGLNAHPNTFSFNTLLNKPNTNSCLPFTLYSTQPNKR